MELGLSEEQQELATTVRALLTKRADSAAVRAAADSEAGYDEALWTTLVEQIGVAALAVPEEHDGVGATLFESLVVLEELGRTLAPTPLLSTVLVTEALLAGADDDARARLLPRVAAGETAALVLDDAAPVLDAGDASLLLAVVGDDLVEVDPASATRARRPSVDRTLRFADVDLTGATTTPIGDGVAARARVEQVGAVAVAALATGLAARALADTVAYTGQRVQFGRAIGSFQAIKHRMAEMLVLAEMSRSASWRAGYAVATRADDATFLAHAAKAYCCDALDRIASETVQLHGGIAITWEHDAQLIFKRAHALAQLFGAAHRHRAAVAL